MINFQSLNLNPKILNALTKKGYTIPTPIQLQAIPHLLLGKDFLGIAQTGTGKTAAFALPILDNLFKSQNQVSPNNTRVLILTPTRELASQIVDNIKLYGEDLGIKCTAIFGGVSINNQIKTVKQGYDIIVATPGRLLDLINQKHLTFSQLEIFVLDEADRMLDMGFIGDVKKIITKLPKVRQNLFFSATMPKDVALLANSILNDPIKVEVTPESTTVEKIDQRVNLVEKANKPLLLKSIIDTQDEGSLFLVFSRTKHGANRVVEFLEKQSVKVAAIHGNKSQSAREKALEGLRQGTIKVLVATDIAARGIDIVGITHVINYDIPNHPESYVHRIGRTARAGREGVAISFCDNSEGDFLRAIEKTIKMKLLVDETHPFHGVKSSAEARSALDVKDRPRSGYKTTRPTSFKPRNENERPPSYFAQSRRWKSDGEGRSQGNKGQDRSSDQQRGVSNDRPNEGRTFDKPTFKDRGESGFGRENSSFKTRSNPTEFRARGSFSSEGRSNEGRSNDDRPKPRSFSNHNSEALTSHRPQGSGFKPRSFDGEKSFRGQGVEGYKANERSFRDSDSGFNSRNFGSNSSKGRYEKSSFGGRSNQRFDQENPRASLTERGDRPSSFANKERPFANSGAKGRVGRAFSGAAKPFFKRSDNKNSNGQGGNDPFKPKK